MTENSNTYEIFPEHTKYVMTLRSGKVIKQPNRTNKPETQTPTKPKLSKNKEDLKERYKPTPLALALRAPFSSALESP